MKKAFTPTFRISGMNDFQKKLHKSLFFLMFSMIGFSSFGQVSGTVFRDFNSNGTKQATATFTEPGVAGISVKAFNAAGTQVGTTATTASDGTYTIAGVSGPVRIEFTNLPSAYFSGPVGSLSNTSVQFLTAPSTANLGINVPDDYCQANPKVVIPCYVAGNEDGHTLVTFPYSYTDNIDGNINTVTTAFPSRDASLGPTAIAENSDFGTSYGIAYDRLNQDIYVGAYIKRKAKLSALGNESPGAIYKLDNPASASPTKSLYVDLNAVFPNSAGANPHPIATTTWIDDNSTVPTVFKRGLGDIEISKDFTKLYAVNLNDKKLYQIPTSGALNNTTIKSFAIPTASMPIANKAGSFCPAADVRPFGLGRDINGNMYVGGTCTAETSQDKTDLTGYVWKFDGTAFTLVLNFPMDYPRGGLEFNPWKDFDAATSFPMGIVSDIEFDVNGDMILGMRDRFGDIVPIASNDGGAPWYPRSGGDILRACTTNGTTYTLESNATCGTLSTAGVSTTGENVPSGPGGKEFYFEDTPGDAGSESSQGSLLLLPGSGEVMSNAFDAVTFLGNGTRPQNNYNTGGVQLHSNTTGKQTGAYDVYLLADANTFGKATGLGDIEIMCDLAPIQIGNRIWKDTDKDGIQDADEVALVGVRVVLYDNNGIAVDTAITDANGNYLFSSATDADVKQKTAYQLKVVSLGSDASVSGLTLTDLTIAPGETSGANTGASLNNNDAFLVSGLPTINYTTGYFGENNHTLDFGFVKSCPYPNCGTVTVIKN
jgi:SdrD B-like domain